MNVHAAHQGWGALGAAVDPGSRAQLLHTLETETVILRHAFFKRGTTVIRRGIANRVILYTIGGSISKDGSEERAPDKRLIYLPAGHEEVLHYERSVHVLAIEILPSWNPQNLKAGWPHEPLPLIAPLYEQLWEVLVAIAERRPRAALRSALNRLILDVLGFTRRKAPQWLRRLVNDLHANWRKPVSLADLSRDYGKSVQHICRSLKSYTGTTLRRYLQLLRLNHAGSLIWGTNMPLSEIANATGFADQSHLTRALSSHFAITPLRLRRAAPCLQRDLFLVAEEP